MMGWFEELVGGVASFADPFAAGMVKNYNQGNLGRWDRIGSGIDVFADPSDMIGVNTKYFKQAFPDLTEQVLETKAANQLGHSLAGIVGYAGAPWMAPIVSGLTDEITLDWESMTPEEKRRAKNEKVVKGLTTYIASEATSPDGGSGSLAGGDALGGGLTGEEAVLAGAEYGYNSAGEGVGPIANTIDPSTGTYYLTGSEAVNSSLPLDEFGTPTNTVDISMPTQTQPSQVSQVGDQPNATPPKDIPEGSWTDDAYKLVKKYGSKGVDIAKALMSPAEEQSAGSYTSGGYQTLTPEEEYMQASRISGVGTSKATKAKNLFNLDYQKKPISYDINAALRELVNYKKKEDVQYG
jgi:hypothetical protein